MKNRNLIYFVFLFTYFLYFNSLAQANDIEKKFINAGLVDVNKIDNTIKVDLVNSDPKRNYFRECPSGKPA